MKPQGTVFVNRYVLFTLFIVIAILIGVVYVLGHGHQSVYYACGANSNKIKQAAIPSYTADTVKYIYVCK